MNFPQWNLQKFKIFGSILDMKLPNDISNDCESQNCYWVLFSVTEFLIAAVTLSLLGQASDMCRETLSLNNFFLAIVVG